MKHCIDCKFYHQDGSCMHQKSIEMFNKDYQFSDAYYITESPGLFKKAMVMRKSNNADLACKTDARWFEEKENEQPEVIEVKPGSSMKIMAWYLFIVCIAIYYLV